MANVLTMLHQDLGPEVFWLVLFLMFVFLGDLIFVLLRKRSTEKALKESVAQYNLLLTSAAEGIYGLDLDGNCTFCNPACLKLLGYVRESDLLGKNLHAMIHHTRTDGTPYPKEMCKICHAYLYNSEVHLEDEVLWRADGTSFPVEYWSYPLRQGDQTIGAVVSFLDITERKQAEQKLKTANEELDAFVHTVSHDLRTPISAVISYADLIKETARGELSPQTLELVATIEQQGEKMALIVEDLLVLATVGRIPAPAARIDTNKVLVFVLQELERLIHQTGTRIEVEELPPVQIPESLLIQVFENLVGNALRYSGLQGGTIEIGGERQGHCVTYFVRDHGVGLPPKEWEHVFDTFYRGSTSLQKAGTGVGLSTVQKICRLYGGRASVKETPEVEPLSALG
jgi:PAS domain S-box-containing protein